jgi:cyclic nucleotide-binding protein
MRVESSVTSVSWIPLEAVEGTTRLVFGTGLAHYDPPPPDVLTDLEELRRSDRFRFANELRGHIDVDGGRIVGWGQEGGGHIGATILRGIGRSVTVPAVAYPDLRPDPVACETSVRFVQTAGGRTGVPMPRLSTRQVHFAAPPAWTTLALTLHADGRAEHELLGASPFPRHWVYDGHGHLVLKSGVIDFARWAHVALRHDSPWGGRDAAPVVAEAETAIERQLSAVIIDSRPGWRRLRPGETLVEQGDEGGEVFLLFDGILTVETGGLEVAELGPGAVVGEMALVDHGRRTATLRALTPCRIAVVPPEGIDLRALAELAAGRRPAGSGAAGAPQREEGPGGPGR